MIPLIISVLFAASYSHVMRHGQERKCSMVWVGGISYAVACAVSVAIWTFLPGTELGCQELVFGAIIVTSVGAMVLWRERYNRRAIAGMILALLTMIFISVDVVALLRGLK